MQKSELNIYPEKKVSAETELQWVKRANVKEWKPERGEEGRRVTGGSTGETYILDQFPIHKGGTSGSSMATIT